MSKPFRCRDGTGTFLVDIPPVSHEVMVIVEAPVSDGYSLSLEVVLHSTLHIPSEHRQVQLLQDCRTCSPWVDCASLCQLPTVSLPS